MRFVVVSIFNEETEISNLPQSDDLQPLELSLDRPVIESVNNVLIDSNVDRASDLGSLREAIFVCGIQ